MQVKEENKAIKLCEEIVGLEGLGTVPHRSPAAPRLWFGSETSYLYFRLFVDPWPTASVGINSGCLWERKRGVISENRLDSLLQGETWFVSLIASNCFWYNVWLRGRCGSLLSLPSCCCQSGSVREVQPTVAVVFTSWSHRRALRGRGSSLFLLCSPVITGHSWEDSVHWTCLVHLLL